ncbi:MAG: Nif3-like dinuclear metal center hexameric protein [Flavobacteriaceae bacterium]
MTIQQVTDILEELAPLANAEDFDNVGLLVGNPNTEVTGILVTLDTLENVVDEAIGKGCNLIVSFHPIIFKGLKKITEADYVERTVAKTISNKIGIYSMHTALDNSPKGVNAKICEVLGIVNARILIPKKNVIKKLVTFVPKNKADALRNALFSAGAGTIGNYSHCSFSMDGRGSFNPNENANPSVGVIGKTHFEEETQIGVTYTKADEAKILKALFTSHPYEEVAYEISTLENQHQNLGMGMIGELPSPMKELDFLSFVKKKMNAQGIRHSALLGRKIHKVAVLGGSGSFAIPAAKAQKADILITADIKYHQFLQAEGKLIIADIGHYETEQYTKNLIADYLTEKIPNFAIRLSESITNPIKYL